jgi:tRNA A-37 threonylcarbamoyl transferase component Bud32
VDFPSILKAQPIFIALSMASKHQGISSSLSSSTRPDPGPVKREMEEGRGRKRSASSESTIKPLQKKLKEESHLQNQTKKPTEPSPNTQQQQLQKRPQLKVKTRTDIVRSLLQRLVSQGDPNSKFVLRDRIGEGAFGAVWVATTKDTKRKVAVKIQHLSPEKIHSRLVSEISIMKNLNHQNVTEYTDSFIVQDKLWIVMDYVEGLNVERITDCYDHLGLRMKTNFISAILKGVLQALIYLHGLDVIHRDVKGANVLVGTNGNVKLADFGLSTQEGRCMAQCGTFLYMAPEVIKGQRYTKNIDIWSLGMTAVEMVNNDKPYSEMKSLEGVKERILNNITPVINYENQLPHALKHFIESCLNPDPKQRKSATQLRPHALFSFYQASAREVGETVASIQEHLFEIEWGQP